MKADKTYKKIGIASAIMMGSIFLSRILGIFRESTIAAVGGVQAEVDAYQIAFIIPEILNHIVASGFLSVTFIPIFTHYLSKQKENQGYRVFSNILNIFGLLLICLIGICLIWAPEIVAIAAPGITDPETYNLAVKMTRIIIPAQFFFFTGGLLMAVQFAKEQFFLPALAPLFYNLCIIMGGLVLGPVLGMEGFAWGALAGAFIGNFAIQVYGARKAGARYFYNFTITHPDLYKYIKLTLPLMLGLTMTFSVELLFKVFGSYLNTGSIASMNYAVRIMFVLVGLFGQAVGVASYPYLAKLADNQEFFEMNRLLNHTLKFIFLVIPVSVLFIILSKEIVLMLYQRYQFDAEATNLTAGILPFFMMGAFAFAAQNIVSRGFYAIQNTLFPVIFTTLCVGLSLPVLWWLMNLMGPKGIALGLSITTALQCFVLYECWNIKNKNTQKNEVYRFFLKMLPVSLLIWVILKLSADFIRILIHPENFINCLMISIIIGTEFVVLFILSGKIFSIPQISEFQKKVLEKFRR